MANTSVSAAVTERTELEQAYQAELEPEIAAFIEESYALALNEPSSFTLATVAALWAGVINRVALAIPQASNLTRFLVDHPLISIVFAAGGAALSAAQREGLSAAVSKDALKAAFGLLPDPAEALPGLLERLGLTGAQPGRVTGPAGNRTWAKDSETSARTGATADFGSSMLQQLREEGYTHKRWSTRYDSRVRETHAAADRQTVPLEEAFIVGGTSLMFPADPMGADLSQTIACRCVIIGVSFGESPKDHPAGTAPWNNPRPR